MEKNSKIYLAGHDGLVGSAIMRTLRNRGYNNIITRTIKKLDLTNQQATATFFQHEKPEYVFLAAAKVGGIMANNRYRAQFIYENIQIQNNVIHQSFLNKVKKLLFLGSSCIYPKNAPQPIKEEYLLTGELEYTNEPYAIAKIAGLKMCESYNIQYGTNFISVMPTNLYGPGDNYDLEKSHVLAAFVRKFHLAKCLENGNFDALREDFKRRPLKEVKGRENEGTKERKYESTTERMSENEIIGVLNNYGIELKNSQKFVNLTLWGTGKVYREFLHVDDMADACLYIIQNVNTTNSRNQLKFVKYAAYEARNTHINIGTGKDLTIKELAKMIANIVGFKGEIKWDSTKPDGTPRKLLDVNRLKKLGWAYNIALNEGLKKNYSDYIECIR